MKCVVIAIVCAPDGCGSRKYFLVMKVAMLHWIMQRRKLPIKSYQVVSITFKNCIFSEVRKSQRCTYVSAGMAALHFADNSELSL
jgi:hypothetical protein